MTPSVTQVFTGFEVAGYSIFLGAIPFGLLLTRAAGLGDIRAIGSGNIGATNVLRTGRKGLAAATLLLDAAKAAAAVLLAQYTVGSSWLPWAAFCAVLGHCYSPALNFKGGKGLASFLGALIAMDWRVGAVACAAWLVGAFSVRISSVGALVSCAAAPVAAYVLLPRNWWVAVAATSVLVLWRHEANIRRLLAGQEPRFGGKG